MIEIIIGTLLSMFIAILLSLLYQHYKEIQIKQLKDTIKNQESFIKASDNYIKFLEEYGKTLLSIVLRNNDTDKDGKTDSSI
jgi:hypothetical protein